MEGIVVQLEEYPLLLGGTHNGLVIQRKTAVIRVSQDVYIGIFHRFDGCPGISVFSGVFLHAGRMHAGDDHIHLLQQIFVHVDPAVRVHNVDFSSVADLDAIHGPWKNPHVHEIIFMAGSRHGHSVFGDP